ncbi:MAG: NADH-quinone oxidoreductase subunit C [Candidatus Korarchaeota archaeon]|nr:NADH-quinone oxidoreductase subunit C [Candidatus Korarchaeota archaeon]
MSKERLEDLIPWAEEVHEERTNIFEIRIPREKLRDTVLALEQAYGMLQVSMITGTDFGDRFELAYFLWLHGPRKYVVLKTSCPRDSPEVDTLVDLIPGIHVYENEVYDLLGVNFRGNEKLVSPFLKPETMRPDEYPLRKDWKGG